MPWIPNRGIAMSELLRVDSMSVGFSTDRGEIAVTDKVSFTVNAGEVFALVGESGCGKSVTAMGLLGLLPFPSGRILHGQAWFQGVDLLALSKEALRAFRGQQIGFIFQEPMASLNPVLRIEKQMLECLPYEEASVVLDRAKILLKQAGISEVERILKAYPHELSGGMLQRVMIVMALLPKPKLLIADEPTTALDVTVQSQVMRSLANLCRNDGVGLLLITHNLALVAQYADRVAVMYAGRKVEEGKVEQVLQAPLHPYTQGLLAAIPRSLGLQSLKAIPGSVPKAKDFVPGCRFATRCEKRSEKCLERPNWRSIGDDHSLECHHA